MRSDLFAANVEIEHGDRMSLQNRRLVKVPLDGEGVPLMRCRGKGELFLARNADELHLIDLEGDSLTVKGANVLAFEPGLTWEIRKVEGASVLSGDVFNMVFSGAGRVALSACGTPVVLDAAQAPTYADLVGHCVVVLVAGPSGAHGRGGRIDRARVGGGVSARLRGRGLRRRARLGGPGRTEARPQGCRQLARLGRPTPNRNES